MQNRDQHLEENCHKGIRFQECPNSVSDSHSHGTKIETEDAESPKGFLRRLVQFAICILRFLLSVFDEEKITPCLHSSSLKSKIPWLPPHSITEGATKDEFGNLIVDVVHRNAFNLKKRRTMFALLDNLQDMVPFYLPGRYHKMDCFSLYKNTKSIGNYWANAVHFTISNFLLGVKVLKSFEAQLKKNPNKLEHDSVFISNTLKRIHIKTLDNVEECESAEEFLLEPWVLLQLPFEPVILHQWAVALMAEALRFQRQITDFNTMAYPEHLKSAVDELSTIASLLLNGANTFLSFVAKFIKNDSINQNHMDAAATLYWDEFQEVLPQVLPALKFVLSEDCKAIVLNLKRMAWSKNEAERTRWRKIDFKCIPSIYSHAYWESHQVHQFLFPKGDLEVDDPETLMFKYDEISANRMTSDYDCGLLLKKLIEEKIINPGRLRGESKEIILETAARHSSALEVFCEHYNHFKGLTQKKVVAADKGVIYDVLKLFADIKCDEAIGLLTQTLFELVNTEVKASMIYIDLGIADGPEMRVEEIDAKLNDAFLSSEWTYQKLMMRMQAACFSPNRTQLPDREEMSMEEIAEHFQERIRNIVVQMIEKHYGYLIRGPPFNYHPEIITVQYILPCFVASYLEMERTNDSNQAKEEYLRFVHELVTSYEQHEFSLELTQSTHNQRYFVFNKTFLLKIFTNIEGQNFKLCNAIGKIAPFCLEHVVKGLFKISAFSKVPNWFICCNCIDCAASKESDDSWFYQKNMIFKRIHASLDKLGKIPSAPVHYAGALGVVLSYIIERNPKLVEHPTLSFLALILRHRMNASAVKFNEYYYCEADSKIYIYRDVQGLSDKQLFNFIYFQIVRAIFIDGNIQLKNRVSEGAERQCFPIDLYGKLYLCILDQDWWKLKIITSKGNVDKNGEDLSLIPFSLARKSQCCRDLLIKSMSPNGKLYMSKPGAITFFPMKHCRWCGLVKSKTLRLCPECRDNKDYPDINYFCSKKCETECLQIQHTEEHARFLLMQLEIDF